MSRIKILFIIPTLGGGGSERVFSTLANTIDPSVFEPIFVILDSRHDFYTLDESRVRVVRFQQASIKFGFSVIRQIVREVRPHIIISTLNHLNLMMALMRFALPRDIRYIARESSIVSINQQNLRSPRLYGLLTRWFYPYFDRIICQSNDMKTDFTANFGLLENQLSVINNPVNTAKIWEKSLEKPTDNSIESCQKPHFVTVGRLDFAKGIDRLLIVLSKLDFDFSFDIIGEGIEMENLKNQAKSLKINEKVRFLGSQKNPFPFVAAADVFLFGSRYEGFPNVLIEAGACGTPIVAFACKGGITEILRGDGDNGFAVLDGDFAAFENAIRRAITTNFDRQKIKNLTDERFGEAQILKKYEAVFLELTPSVF